MPATRPQHEPQQRAGYVSTSPDRGPSTFWDAQRVRLVCRDEDWLNNKSKFLDTFKTYNHFTVNYRVRLPYTNPGDPGYPCEGYTIDSQVAYECLLVGLTICGAETLPEGSKKYDADEGWEGNITRGLCKELRRRQQQHPTSMTRFLSNSIENSNSSAPVSRRSSPSKSLGHPRDTGKGAIAGSSSSFKPINSRATTEKDKGPGTRGFSSPGSRFSSPYTGKD